MLKFKRKFRRQRVNDIKEKKIDVCPENHTELTNEFCGQNVEIANVKPGDIQSGHLSFKS